MNSEVCSIVLSGKVGEAFQYGKFDDIFGGTALLVR